MFPNRGAAIHYHEDLYNQTISGFLLISEACFLSDVLLADGGGLMVPDKRLPARLRDVPWLSSSSGRCEG